MNRSCIRLENRCKGWPCFHKGIHQRDLNRNKREWNITKQTDKGQQYRVDRLNKENSCSSCHIVDYSAAFQHYLGQMGKV